MNVLVVGATGRTGRHVVQEAIEAGHTVRAFARSVRADRVATGVAAMAGDVYKRQITSFAGWALLALTYVAVALPGVVALAVGGMVARLREASFGCCLRTAPTG